MKKFPYKEYDDRGNLTYYESDGFWIKQNFDEKNNQTTYNCKKCKCKEYQPAYQGKNNKSF